MLPFVRRLSKPELMTHLISARDLRASYGAKVALNGVSFDIEEGTSFALLGPNGAGKTTLINILCTLQRPDSGGIVIAGHDALRYPRRARRNIGVVFQTSSVDDRLTARENLEFHGLVHGLPRRKREARIRQVLELVALEEWEDDVVRSFSGGMRRRLEIARALMHEPKILFLDEPTVGLDAQTRQQIWYYLDPLRREWSLTVLTTTHYIEEVEDADVVCIIDHGSIIAQGSPAGLKKQHGRRWHQIDTIDRAVRQLILERFAGAQPLGVSSVVVPEESFDARALKSPEFEGKILEIRQREPTLESVFLSLTGRELRDRADPGRIGNGRGGERR